jgi:hypothetical protein
MPAHARREPAMSPPAMSPPAMSPPAMGAHTRAGAEEPLRGRGHEATSALIALRCERFGAAMRAHSAARSAQVLQ